MTKRRVGLLGVMPVVALLVGESAWAVVIGHAVNRQDNHLYEINMSTGRTTDKGLVADIAGIPFENVRAIAFDPDSELWGVDATTDQLIQINSDTGEANAIGSGLNLDINEFVGMTFDEGIGTDGSLVISHWVQNNTLNDPTLDPDAWSGFLYTVDSDTGGATFLSDIAWVGQPPGFFGEPLFTDIASINPLFGSPSDFNGTPFIIEPEVGEVNAAVNSGDNEVPREANVGLAATADGVILGIEDINNRIFEATVLETFDIVGVDSGRFDNLAIAPGQNFIETVPEPVTALLGLMGLSALGAATRRRIRG